MILPEKAATQPHEVKTRPVKPESVPRGSFQRTLQKEIRRDQPAKDPSTAGKRAGLSGTETQNKSASQDIAGVNPSTEEKTAEVLTNPGTTSETGTADKTESAAAFFTQVGLEAEFTEGLTATVQAPQTVALGQETMEPSESQTQSGWGSMLARNQASTMVNQASTPTTANSYGSTPWSADASTGVQLDTNHPGQTAASSAGQGAGSTDLQSTPLLAIASKIGEVKNPEEPQGKIDSQHQQTARELAELESLKLTGQKAPVIRPSAAPEHDQTGKESRSDNTYQAVRPEGHTFKSAELNSSVTNKTASFDSDVDAQEVLNQIVRKAELMVKSNNSQMKIELYPEFLGKLTIKVMVEEGAVTARFITDNHQVKQMLEANLSMLRQTLESQGMRVERAEVDVQLSNGSLFDGSHEQRDWNWGNHYFRNHVESGLTDQDVYQITQELLPTEPAPYETYGIAPDGSLNFVI